MDEHLIERAQREQDEELLRLIASRVQYQGESLTECEGCGGEIPQARREAVKGCRMCIACQADEDKRNAGVRRG
ncbi:TraR/DksA C4-type zinc finger protein [Stutzerimonas frequens]|uniref:TraR/DksA C4-type zinc finger protein n=1 Tax=Stutzerimonas frequens TaxID=2968969 RepID=UPI00255243CA|nr:TraR/DksA C4-type zinc finger protein [Stutzerimonas frequens]MDL0441856.1 TraR/DksA C4-type zinc finger protein [Stutzerimonas frequens]